MSPTMAARLKSGSTWKGTTRTPTKASKDWKLLANIFVMNWSSACTFVARPSYSSASTAPSRIRHALNNCWPARKSEASRERDPVDRRHSDMLEDVLRQIGQHERFVLTSHARPDGDAIGSALACCQILCAMGKQAEVVLRDGVPRIYQPLPFAGKVIQAEFVKGDYEAAIILECDSLQRTRLEGLEGRFTISIDHHASGKPFAQVNWIDPKAVATAEMMYRLAREAGVTISPEIATCLYTAVLTDTGSFMFEGTNEHTFALARELVLAGANPAACARNIYFSHSTSKMRLLGADWLRP